MITHVLAAALISYPPPECYNQEPDLAAHADLHAIELSHGVPPERYGILSSIWCVESRWSPDGRELWGDEGKALGPFQFWKAQADWCENTFPYTGKRDPRLSLRWSAHCWLSRVNYILHQTRRRCGFKGTKAWDLAEARVSNHHRYGWDCSAKSAHVRHLERLKKGR